MGRAGSASRRWDSRVLHFLPSTDRQWNSLHLWDTAVATAILHSTEVKASTTCRFVPTPRQRLTHAEDRRSHPRSSCCTVAAGMSCGTLQMMRDLESMSSNLLLFLWLTYVHRWSGLHPDPSARGGEGCFSSAAKAASSTLPWSCQTWVAAVGSVPPMFPCSGIVVALARLLWCVAAAPFAIFSVFMIR